MRFLPLFLIVVGCAKGPGPSGSAVRTTTGTASGTNAGTTTAGSTTTGSITSGHCPTFAWTDVDGRPPVDPDGDGVHDADCSSDTLEICILDPLGVDEWDFGLVDAGMDGWRGEDCLTGQGGTAICHRIHASDVLTEVCSSGDVVAGETTWFDASKDPVLTYLIDDRGDCFVMGADPSYYDSLGCEVLM